MKKIVVLTGAGISAESGIKTFRDADGLWEGHDIMEVASPLGWKKNPELVLDFYNKRRAQLLTVKPNKAHEILSELEECASEFSSKFSTCSITLLKISGLYCGGYPFFTKQIFISSFNWLRTF